MVAVEVNVKDKNGKSIRGFESKDLRLFEDGVERRVDFFEPLTKKLNSRALAIVFVLDVSGSMTPDELSQLRSAPNGFAQSLSEYHAYIAAMSFGMKVKATQPPTIRRDKLRKSIEKIQQVKDGVSSHTYDATDDTIRSEYKITQNRDDYRIQ